MSLKTKLRSFFASLLVVSISAVASAQKLQPFGPVEYTHDLQPFKMFELRNFESGPDLNEGFFFSYDKLSWSYPGERHTVGSTTAVFRSIDYFPGSPNPPTLVPNNITDGAPDAKFAAGERYEFGYLVGQHGWLASVLDGPEANDINTLGFGAANPTGSVAILFNAPVGYFNGFSDVINATVGTGEQGGVSRIDANGDGIPDGDGFADDRDDDNRHGPDGNDPMNTDTPGPVAGPTDFDDLVTFLPTFQTVTMRNYTRLRGIELMKMYRFKPRNGGGVLEFYYGARYVKFRDNFRVDTTGGTLGTSFWDTTMSNNLVGPQLGFKYQKGRGRWTMNSQGRFLFGYNVQDWDQSGQVGSNIVAGAHNSPLFFNPHAFKHGRQEQNFSPMAEMRLEASYQLTQAISFKLGWTGTYIGNVRRASTSVNYTLPNMGFVDNGTQDIFINGANIGFEINR